MEVDAQIAICPYLVVLHGCFVLLPFKIESEKRQLLCYEHCCKFAECQIHKMWIDFHMKIKEI